MISMDNPNKPPLIVIVGPTACGKTDLAVKLAQYFNGEVVSGDSMQVYRRMDIGTAKVTAQEAQGIPHWLIDIREPNEDFSVADFRREAITCIDDILARGKQPILCGGTGLYINSILNKYHFSAVKGANAELRQKLRDELASQGPQALHDKLRQVDPEGAERIHVNDKHRVIRALEVWYAEGKTIDSHWDEPAEEPPYRPILIGLTRERAALYDRIEARVDQMIDKGLVDEVAGLLEEGVSRDAISMQGLGYRQIASYLQGEFSLDEAIRIIKRDTRHFAKRQLTWFKRDERIHWFKAEDYQEGTELFRAVSSVVEANLKESGMGEGIAGTVPG